MTTCSKCGLSAPTNGPLHCGKCGTTTPFSLPHPPGKVGTRLLTLIPSIFKKEGCGCDDYAAELNRKGDEWCRENREEIVNNILTRAKERFKVLPPFSTSLVQHWVEAALGEAVPESPLWFVAVTTAPRKEPTLDLCVSSLRACGWEPIVFAEPDSSKVPCKTLTNPERLGVWHNWLHAAKTGLASGKPYILTVQDDVVFHPDSKRLAEEHLPSLSGFLSLYTPLHYSKNKEVGINRIHTQSLWGACALAWKREALQEVVDSPTAKNWLGASVRTRGAQRRITEKRKATPWIIANSDTAIGKAMNEAGLPMYFVDPSPTNHIARFSSISHGGNTGKRNCGRCADPMLPLFPQVFPLTALTNIFTTLSPRNLEHQLRCLDTWRKFGPLFAIQLESEAELIRSCFPGEVIVVPDNDKKKVLIHDIWRIAAEKGGGVYTNSDIENNYSLARWQELWTSLPPKTLRIGKRWDYKNRIPKVNKWGIDVYSISPGDKLPELPFYSGVPVWDYWVIYEFLKQGYKLVCDPTCGFLHKEHPKNYTVKDRDPYIEIMEKEYGIGHIPLSAFIQAETEKAYDRDRFPFQGRLWFEHIPKCGGTSLKSAIAKHVKDEFFYNANTAENYRGEQFVFGHNILKAPFYDPSDPKITTLRNPIHRVISLYNHIKKLPTHPKHSDCNLFPLEQCSEISWEFNNQMVKVLSGDTQLGPGSVDNCIDTLKTFDLVGCVNDLPTFFNSLSNILGVKVAPCHMNKGNWNIRNIPNPALQHIIEHNQYDIQLWEKARHEFNLH